MGEFLLELPKFQELISFDSSTLSTSVGIHLEGKDPGVRNVPGGYFPDDGARS